MTTDTSERCKPDPLAHNEEDEQGSYFHPWDALGLRCSAYSGRTDIAAVQVLKGIGEKLYSTEIAAKYELDETLVEFLQEVFCSANWCDYGTSPRGCWFDYDYGPDFGNRLIAEWESYYVRHWGEPSAESHGFSAQS